MEKKTKKASVIAADIARKEIEERILERTPVIRFVFDEKHPRVKG